MRRAQDPNSPTVEPDPRHKTLFATVEPDPRARLHDAIGGGGRESNPPNEDHSFQPL